MPELPEVETVRRGVEPLALGRTITAAVVRDARLRWPVPPQFAAWVRGFTVASVERRAKYLLLRATRGDRLLVHLGMTGRLTRVSPDTPLKTHDHVDLVLDDGHLLRYHDPRRFGAVLPWPADEPGHVLIDHLGPEPLSGDFSAGYLRERAQGRRVAIKHLIMDAGVVVGVGNIYAAEALFRAGVRPTRQAGKLSRAETLRLVDAIRAVLAEAIEQGGTTLRDFANAEGASGYFQQDLYVYDREGQPCRRCGTTIRGARLGNRQSCWCPGCQR